MNLKKFNADEHVEFLKKDLRMGIISWNEYSYLTSKIQEAFDETDPDVRELILMELDDFGISLWHQF